MDVVAGHLYDFPKYYDLIFGSDWKAEYEFLKGCFEKYSKKPVQKIFEPACGTGRLLVRFGRDGLEVSGNDLNEKAVEFCNERFVRYGLKPAAIVGDMANFKVPRKVDAAFNMINTFRHLQTEEEAVAHFSCVADSLLKGGLYVIGLHLTPETDQRCTEECWSASRGNLTVNSRLWSKGVDLEKRQERIGMTYDVHTPTKQFRIEDETIFRTYNAEQMALVILQEPRFEFLDTYDFQYNLEEPIPVTRDTEDVVYVLRRR